MLKFLAILHGVVVAFGLQTDMQLAASAFASAGLLPLAWWAWQRRAIAAVSTAMAYNVGNVVSLGYGTYAYMNYTDLPKGQYPELLTMLCGTSAWMVCAGCIATDLLLGPPPTRPATLRELRNPSLLLVTSAVTIVVFAAMLMAGGLSYRWEGVRAGSEDLQYMVGGTLDIAPLSFFVLGALLQGSLLSTRNLIIYAWVSPFVLVNLLTGAREYAIRVVLMMLFGAVAAGMPTRRFMVLAGTLGVVGAIAFTIIGFARGDQRFQTDDLDSKLEAITDVSEGDSSQGGRVGSHELVISRIYHISAQIVVDDTERWNLAAGFEHFERLAYLGVPKALAPHKKALSDGKEILARDHGYYDKITDKTSFAITLVADAYRRGGLLWVVVASLFIGAGMRLWVQACAVVLTPELYLPAVATLAVYALRFVGQSVLGTIDAIVWRGAKLIVLFFAISVAVRIVRALVAPATGAGAGGGRRGAAIGARR